MANVCTGNMGVLVPRQGTHRKKEQALARHPSSETVCQISSLSSPLWILTGASEGHRGISHSVSHATGGSSTIVG